MENNPFSSGPFEAPKSGAEKSDKNTKKEKKKSVSVEAPVSAHKKDRAQRELARSIDKLPLFERDQKTTAETAAEQPLDTLSPEEQQHIQQETARQHLAAGEQAEPDVAEQRELADEFLGKVAGGQDPETAFAETVEQADLSEAERTELLAGAVPEPPEAADAQPEATTEEDGTIDTSEDTEGVVNWRSKSTAAPKPARGASGLRPPPPPAPPVIGGSAAGGPRGSSGPTPPAPLTPNSLPPKVEAYYEQRDKARDLLLIGLVGYLIGRRRGRIRTEKKLLPVQRKLEKQVKQLQEDLTYKEKQLATVKARRQPVEARPAVVPAERTQPGRSETRLGMKKPAPAERLGHMVIAVEAPRKTGERASAEKSGSIRSSFRAEQVPDMNRNELLELSEKILVEGATLRSIYESRLIGERQLRYLVSEYLRGKDIRKDLRREMVEHEIDFERDPILRDRVRSRLTGGSNGTNGLSAMLAKAGITANDEQDPSLKRQIQKEAARQAALGRKNHRQRVIADTALATAVVVLAVVVAILALGR